MDKKIKISVVIPCYKSEKTITKVVGGLQEVFSVRQEYLYEIILVNDGSPDDTWNIIKQLATTNSNIKAVNLAKNFGQHSAMMAGYKQANGDLIAGLDDDGENNTNDLFKLIDKLNEGHDCVCAEYPSHESFFRSMGTKLNNAMAVYMLNKPKEITLTSYYVVRRFVINQVLKYEHSYPYIAGLFLQASSNWATVKLIRSERIAGTSNYNLKKLLSLWVNGFTAFSVKPLRFATGLGAFLSGVGFIWGIVLIVRKLMNIDIALGYTSIMASLMFFFGIVMIILGIIGEYVGRIYISLNNSPQYVIREIVEKEDKQELANK